MRYPYGRVYKWRVKFGGMGATMVARMKELEDENRRLKKMCMDEKIKSEVDAGKRSRFSRCWWLVWRRRRSSGMTVAATSAYMKPWFNVNLFPRYRCCALGRRWFKWRVKEHPGHKNCGTWSVVCIDLYRNDPLVPNLSSRRKDPALLAFGDALRRVRKARSISKEQLALIAAADRSHVGRVERGDNNVALLTLVQPAAAPDKTVAGLMEQAGL